MPSSACSQQFSDLVIPPSISSPPHSPPLRDHLTLIFASATSTPYQSYSHIYHHRIAMSWSLCRGKGGPCLCSGFKKGKQGKQGRGCQDCGHSKRRHTTSPKIATLSPPPPSHPNDTVTTVLARYAKHHGGDIPSLEDLKPVVSHSKALKEVLPGYHGGRGNPSLGTSSVRLFQRIHYISSER